MSKNKKKRKNFFLLSVFFERKKLNPAAQLKTGSLLVTSKELAL